MIFVEHTNDVVAASGTIVISCGPAFISPSEKSMKVSSGPSAENRIY